MFGIEPWTIRQLWTVTEPRGPFSHDDVVEPHLRQVAVVDGTDPLAVVAVEVEQVLVMAAGDHAHRPHLVVDIVQVDADGERRIVRMGPELDVLVPFHLLAAVGPFEVQLGMMELDVGAEQVLGKVDDRPAKAELLIEPDPGSPDG